MAENKRKLADIKGGVDRYENTFLIGGKWKEIKHIEDALNIQPTEEFARYYAEAEAVKASVKARLK